MQPERIAIVILEGGNPLDPIEQQMVSVRKAMTLDVVEKVKHIPEIDGVYLSTNYPDLAESAAALGVTVVEEEQPFHFGRCLQNVVNLHQLDGVIYVGGASCPFLTGDEFRQIAQELRTRKSVVYTNNPQSSDIVAFTPGDAINHIELPENDNTLATALRNQAGLERVLLPHSVGVHFDIDTPSDVLVMSLSPKVGPRTRQALDALRWDNSRVRRAMELIALPQSNILLAGRVNPWTMSHVGTYYRCRLRVISEERGMRALGRAERGEVHSMLGFLLEQLSPRGFVDYISSIADAAFIDTRVLFAHLHRSLEEGQRFSSDLGVLERIGDELVEELTEAVFKAPIPIILGGHSLVAGSMWSLVDTLRYEAGESALPASYGSIAITADHPLAGCRLREAVANDKLAGELLAARMEGRLRYHLRGDTVLEPGMTLYVRSGS